MQVLANNMAAVGFLEVFFAKRSLCILILCDLIQQLTSLALQVPAQYSNFGIAISNIEDKLGSQALKSDLNSTIKNIATAYMWKKM